MARSSFLAEKEVGWVGRKNLIGKTGGGEGGRGGGWGVGRGVEWGVRSTAGRFSTPLSGESRLGCLASASTSDCCPSTEHNFDSFSGESPNHRGMGSGISGPCLPDKCILS
jgi:hypothetical protein